MNLSSWTYAFEISPSYGRRSQTYVENERKRVGHGLQEV